MCEFYYIALIEHMIAVKTLLGYNNLFSTNNHQRNKIIYNT